MLLREELQLEGHCCSCLSGRFKECHRGKLSLQYFLFIFLRETIIENTNNNNNSEYYKENNSRKDEAAHAEGTFKKQYRPLLATVQEHKN